MGPTMGGTAAEISTLLRIEKEGSSHQRAPYMVPNCRVPGCRTHAGATIWRQTAARCAELEADQLPNHDRKRLPLGMDAATTREVKRSPRRRPGRHSSVVRRRTPVMMANDACTTAGRSPSHARTGYDGAARRV